MNSPASEMAVLSACFGALLALVLALPSPWAQEAGESANRRVQELVDTGQGVLLSLGDALGTAPAAPDSTEPEASSLAATEEAEDDDIDVAVEATASAPQEPAQDDVSMAETEGAAAIDAAPDTTVAETVEPEDDMWPPSPQEVVVPDFDEQAAAGVEVVRDMESETAQPALEEGDAAADEIAGAARDQALPPAEETAVTAQETETVAEAPPDDSEQPGPAAEETQTAMAVEEPAPQGETADGGLDAGPVPLRTAELGNPESIGPYRLWLASFRTVREAKDGWRDLAMAQQDLLGDLTPIIVLKDLGAEEGTFFRLQAGPLQTQASAVARCDGLKDRGLYCTVLGP